MVLSLSVSSSLVGSIFPVSLAVSLTEGGIGSALKGVGAISCNSVFRLHSEIILCAVILV